MKSLSVAKIRFVSRLFLPLLLTLMLSLSLITGSAYAQTEFKLTASDADILVAESLPKEFALEGNYPNPFNPQTTIRFGVTETSDVRLVVYNMLGREVRVLVQGIVSSGMHEATFDASGLPSGSYIYTLTTPEGRISKMLALLK